jgi:hypothetical protein
MAAPITQPEIVTPLATVPSAPAQAMGRDLVFTPIQRVVIFATLILMLAPWVVIAAHFFLSTSWPFVKELGRLYTPMVAPFQGIAKSIGSGLQMPAKDIVYLIAALAFFALGLFIFMIASQVLHQKTVLVPQAELDARFQASKELREGLGVIFALVIGGMLIYWWINNPVTTSPGVVPGTGDGTLMVSADNGYISVDGTQYGQGGITITLAAGSYVVSAVAPSTGNTCWQSNINVVAGGTSQIKNDTWCR